MTSQVSFFKGNMMGTRWRNRLGHWALMLKVLGSIPTEDEPYTTTNSNRQLITLQRIIQDEVDRQHSGLSKPNHSQKNL